ncbi:MAG: hypothetical protein D6731_20355 [Planctomycetota bacterium]|nr:MAG: hypothetical protein D6731_20355 [Planctomycetota bacterium]
MIRKLGMALLPLLAFAGGTAAALAARGHLDAAGLAGLPGVGALFGGSAHAAEESAHGEGEGHDEEAAEHGAPAHPAETAVDEVFDLPRPFEAEELQALVRELRSARDRYREGLIALEHRRATLDRLARELDERRAEVDEVMSSLANARAKLEADRVEFEAHRIRMNEEERAALGPMVKAFEAMRPDSAAQRLGRLDLNTQAKVLSLMKARKAAKLLAALAPDQAAEVSLRMGRIRRTTDGKDS